MKIFIIGGTGLLGYHSTLDLMLKAMGKNKKVFYIPCFLATYKGRIMKKEHAAKGEESGLDPDYLFRDIQCRFLYYDTASSMTELGYSGGGIEASIKKTIEACI